jgi:hypothetical protein
MENFFLPPLPTDFVPDFLIQPNAISNDERLTFQSANDTSLNRDDSSRVDRFPKDEDGSSPFFDILDNIADDLAQEREPFTTLSRDQWIEAAAFLSQALVKGLRKKAENMGADSLFNDLSLESRENLTFFANDVEKLHRFFKIPYHERDSLEYCTNCLQAQGSVPTVENWKAQLELCGHDATAAKHSLVNQFMLKFNTSMHEWYEENRKMAHDEVVNRIVNPANPPLVAADPRILEWCHRYANQARENLTNHLDIKAKNEAQDNFSHQIVAYELNHANDLATKKQQLEAQLHLEVTQIRQDSDARIAKIRQDAAQQIRFAEIESQRTVEEAKNILRLEEESRKTTIQDPVARKKRRGSVSIISSPIVMKRQDLDLPDPQPTLPAPPTEPSVPDPLTSMMAMFSKHFETLTKRLDRIETNANNANSYTSTWETGCDPAKPWGLTTEQEDNRNVPYDASKYDNFNYEDPAFYDNPHDVGVVYPEDDITSAVPYPTAAVQEVEDCMLLSGPPTPTAPEPPVAPSGFRPPERAKRVDFINPNLATDSFGMTGGRCLPDGSVSFAPLPKTTKRPPPKGSQADLSEDTLQGLPKDTIRAHAKARFDMNIPKTCRKEDMINRYLNAARNANKPGAPKQSKLSFASAAASTANNNNGFTTVPIRQTTPSAWSTSTAPPPRPRAPPKPRSNTTTWIIRPRMGSNGLVERPFDGAADKLTDWYRQRLQANAGGSKPALTLLSGKWANGPKSIFSLIFAGVIPPNTLRRYTPLFLEKFDTDHFFHPAEDMKKIALFNIPMKRDALGNVPTRRELFDEIMRGGSLAGLDYFDGPCWTPNSRNNPDASTGVAHILVRAPTERALTTFFRRNTYMFNARIASQTAIPPRPFNQCTRCHQLNHTIDRCRLPSTASVCSHCGSHKHKSAQHKLLCKDVHDGPSCSCPPKCFLCRNARKSPAQFIGHTALDSACPLRRYTFVPSGPANANTDLTNV